MAGAVVHMLASAVINVEGDVVHKIWGAVATV